MKTLKAEAGISMAKTSRNLLANSLMRLRLTAIAALLCCCLSLHAQTSWQSVEITNYYHGLHYMGMSGDTLTFQLTLGVEDAPAISVGGFEGLLHFPNLHSEPDQVLASVENTWLTAGLQDPQPIFEYSPSQKSLSVQYLREDDTPTDGHGSILRICLIRQGGFTPSEATTYLTDGIVMVENINLRLASGNAHGINNSSANSPALQVPTASPQPSFSVSPNPTTDHIDITVPNPQGCTLRLWTLQPKLILEQPCQQDQRLDLSHLPAGTYHLTLEWPDHKESRLIVKQ